MTNNRAEKKAARAIKDELGISYTHALRLMRTAFDYDPNLTYNDRWLIIHVRELLERERETP